MTTDLPLDRGRSASITDQIEMLNGRSQSSRELSSAAIESEGLAREERRRAELIQEQIIALLAQKTAAEDNSKKYSKQAEARQQAAREQSFSETQTSKQAAFRHMLSDEVFTRVAVGLCRTEDRDYLEAVAERRQGFDDPTDLKVLLWNAIAGNDSDFLAGAARIVSECLGKKITDTDVRAIKSSIACFNSDTIQGLGNHLQTPQSPERAPEVESDSRARDITPSKQIDHTRPQAHTVVDEEPSQAAANNDIEEEQLKSGEFRSRRSIRSDRLGHETHNEQHSNTLLKEESLTPGGANGRRRSMDDIDNGNEDEAAPQLRTASAADIGEDFLHDEEVEMLSVLASSSSTFNPHKRSREEESPTSKSAPEPKTSKRSRTTKDANHILPRIRSFVKNIEDMAENDTLQGLDFICASCGTGSSEMKDPRVTQCLHLYENKCLIHMRSGRGKRGPVSCTYSGCGKDVGTNANKITIEVLEGLKEKHLVGPGDVPVETEDKQVQDTEIETEDDGDD